MRSPDQPGQLRTNPANTGTHLRHNQPCWLQHGDSHPLLSVCTTDGDQTRMNRSEVTLQVPSIFLNLFLYATELLYLKLRGVLHQRHTQPRSTFKTRKLLVLLFLHLCAQLKTPHILLIPCTTSWTPLAEKPFPCRCEENHGKSQWNNYNFFHRGFLLSGNTSYLENLTRFHTASIHGLSHSIATREMCLPGKQDAVNL